jgi:hypothetical protein
VFEFQGCYRKPGRPCRRLTSASAGSEGVQWAWLISDPARNGSKTFHLTAVTADAGGPGCITVLWLSEFAESMNLPFQYSSLRLGREEDLHGLAKSCIISCDTTDNSSYSSLIKLSYFSAASRFYVLSWRSSSKMRCSGSAEASSPSRSSSTKHCTTSLQCWTPWPAASVPGACGEGDAGAKDRGSRRAAATSGDLEGFRACDLSSFNISQAKMLVGLCGFGVVHEEGRLALCWNSRPSTWSPV